MGTRRTRAPPAQPRGAARVVGTRRRQRSTRKKRLPKMRIKEKNAVPAIVRALGTRGKKPLRRTWTWNRATAPTSFKMMTMTTKTTCPTQREVTGAMSTRYWRTRNASRVEGDQKPLGHQGECGQIFTLRLVPHFPSSQHRDIAKQTSQKNHHKDRDRPSSSSSRHKSHLVRRRRLRLRARSRREVFGSQRPWERTRTRMLTSPSRKSSGRRARVSSRFGGSFRRRGRAGRPPRSNWAPDNRMRMRRRRTIMLPPAPHLPTNIPIRSGDPPNHRLLLIT
mmetsp:Transcript_25924/g.65338  ORF Transcript_25924/g.65338 Transcript_25924/m.65338 type:complete len:279 (+) Transcript_25924:1033-1869(+)